MCKLCITSQMTPVFEDEDGLDDIYYMVAYCEYCNKPIKTFDHLELKFEDDYGRDYDYYKLHIGCYLKMCREHGVAPKKIWLE